MQKEIHEPSRTGSYLGISQHPRNSPTTGKLLHHVETVLGSQAMKAIQRVVSPEYFIQDLQIENHLQFSEQLSNTIYRSFISRSGCKELSTTIETNPDHGYAHCRRIEKFIKEFFAKDKELRNREDILYFMPAMYLAIRIHDLIEVGTGEKNGHDAAAALLSIGILRNARKGINKFIQEYTGSKIKFPKKDYEKLMVATAYMCLHHSKPEKMLTSEQIQQNGFIDLNQVLTDAEQVAKKRGITLEEFFPPYATISDTINDIRSGVFKILSSSRSTRTDIEGLLTSTRIFAVGDKLDGYVPEGLSGARTVLTRPDRDFYILEEYHDIESEFMMRVLDGGQHESKCDLNRLLFELTRIGSFEGISGWIDIRYSRALLAKGDFLFQAIKRFLDGDFTKYLKPYENREKEIIETELLRAGAGHNQVRATLNMETENRPNEVRRLLIALGSDVSSFDVRMYYLSQEKNIVSDALSRKHHKLLASGITEDTKERIIKLLSMAIKQQRAEVMQVPGPITLKPPYDSYDYPGKRLVENTH